MSPSSNQARDRHERDSVWMLLDTRAFTKPPRFSGNDEDWKPIFGYVGLMSQAHSKEGAELTSTRTEAKCRSGRDSQPNAQATCSIGPVEVQMDYMFEPKGDASSARLTVRWRVTIWCNATVVPAKGPVSWPSIESLAQTSTFRLDDSSTCRSAPRGSHARIGALLSAATRTCEDRSKP
eukprot:1254118-Amphidinium_carterae.1